MVRKYAASLALLLLIACPFTGKRQDDVVIMKNGDKCTGEIRAPRYRELIFRSDHMKIVSIWTGDMWSYCKSKDTFIVGLSNGERVTGFIEKPNAGSDGSDLTIVAKVQTFPSSEPRVRSCHIRRESRSRTGDDASLRKPRSSRASRLTERTLL